MTVADIAYFLMNCLLIVIGIATWDTFEQKSKKLLYFIVPISLLQYFAGI